MGEVIGNYEIVSELKRGGMGVLYAARHVAIGQQVVIKKLRPEHAANREVVQRFFQEARAAAVLDDPGVVRIFDQGVLADGSAYIVMELLQGETLSDRLKQVHRLPVDRALVLLRQTARAVGKAHQRGIVHRDLKPDNLFVVPDPDLPGGERIKVLDFGIAKLLGDRPLVQTMDQTPMGTPDYMSPEQWASAGQVDARTDIYALGVIFFEMLTGRPPFPGPGLAQLAHQHRSMAPPPPSSIDPSLAPLDAVVLRALSKRASDRFASLEELMEALPTDGFSAVPLLSAAPLLKREPWEEATLVTDQRPVVTAATTLRGSATARQQARNHLPPAANPRRSWAIGAGLALATGIGLAVILPSGEEPGVVQQGGGGGEPPAMQTLGARVAAERRVEAFDAGVVVALRAPAMDAAIAKTEAPVAAVAPEVPVAAAAPGAPLGAPPGRELPQRPHDAEPIKNPQKEKPASLERRAPPGAGASSPGKLLHAGRPITPASLVVKPEPPPVAPRFVETLGKSELNQSISTVKPRISRCGQKYSGIRGRVSIKFTVGQDGLVTFGNVVESPDERLGLCVLVAIESARFARSKKGGRFTYQISF